MNRIVSLIAQDRPGDLQEFFTSTEGVLTSCTHMNGGLQ